jgi:hypothetical protein
VIDGMNDVVLMPMRKKTGGAERRRPHFPGQCPGSIVRFGAKK